MYTVDRETGPGSGAETDADQRTRLAQETQGLAAAEAELDAGLYVDVGKVRARIDSRPTVTPLPPPPTRRR
ncbi:MAG: hypothetical protein U1E70_09540 [Acetobacteraceae bacterium]|nr:hypothetical protein [Pseudomonadota bacterium]